MTLTKDRDRFHQPGGTELTFPEIEQMIAEYPSQFPTPQYMHFIKKALTKGFTVTLYMPAEGRSKYVRVSDKEQFWKKPYLVRFSNHPPNRDKENRGTCDFFVGRNNNITTTTAQAWEAMMKYFSKRST